jgi:hypothetical protein
VSILVIFWLFVSLGLLFFVSFVPQSLSCLPGSFDSDLCRVLPVFLLRQQALARQTSDISMLKVSYKSARRGKQANQRSRRRQRESLLSPSRGGPDRQSGDHGDSWSTHCGCWSASGLFVVRDGGVRQVSSRGTYLPQKIDSGYLKLCKRSWKASQTRRMPIKANTLTEIRRIARHNKPRSSVPLRDNLRKSLGSTGQLRTMPRKPT